MEGHEWRREERGEMRWILRKKEESGEEKTKGGCKCERGQERVKRIEWRRMRRGKLL